MNKKTLLGIGLATVLGLNLSFGALLGTGFTYQGKLADGGNAVTGLYDFNFTVWNAATGGAQFGPAVNLAAVPVTNGTFTATLDFGNIFDGTALWLAISVKTNSAVTYNPLTPRQPLSPSPYAVYASSSGVASLANGVTAGSIVAVDLAPGAVTSSAIANGAVTTAKLAPDSVTHIELKSDVLSLPKVTAGLVTNVGENIVIAGSGNSIATNAFTGLGFQFYPPSGEGAILSSYANGFDGYGLITFYTKNGPGNAPQKHMIIDTDGSVGIVGPDRMVVKANGNVGIGTNIPQAALHVVGTIMASNFVGSGTGLLGVAQLGSSQVFTGTPLFNPPSGPPFNVGSTVLVPNLNADLLDGLNASAFWKLGGNAGTTPGTDFIGTTDNKGLEFKVNAVRGLRIESDPVYSTPNVIGGSANLITSGVGNFIGAGGQPGFGTNYIEGNVNVIGGGWENHITNYSYETTIAGGYFNAAGANHAAIGGGEYNAVTGLAATVPGGSQNLAAGNYSFAAGNRAKANHQGSFVWADSQAADLATTANDQFLVRAAGGLQVFGGSLVVDAGNANTGSGIPGLLFGANSGEAIASKRDTGGNQYGLDFYTGFNRRMSLSQAGNLSMYDNAIFLRGQFGDGTFDPNHGLGYRGAAIPFAGIAPDGPALFGYSGGVLGTEQYGTEKVALLWNASGNVGINNTNPVVALDVVGSVRATGLLRTGSETNAAPPSYPSNPDGSFGLVVRRISSTSSVSNSVVARTDRVTLVRDGTSAGLNLVFASGTSRQSVACTGIDRSGNQVTRQLAINSAPAWTVVFSDAQKVVHYDISFGNPYNNGHTCHVVLDRYDDNTISDNWLVGTVTSTYNQ